MKPEEQIRLRSSNQCDLCRSAAITSVYEVLPQQSSNEEDTIMICDKCRAQIGKKEELDISHWNVLTTSMWSEVPGIQVVSWRMLNRLRRESWAMDSLDMFYLDEERLAWAKAMGDHESDAAVDLHKGSNGQVFPVLLQ